MHRATPRPPAPICRPAPLRNAFSSSTATGSSSSTNGSSATSQTSGQVSAGGAASTSTMPTPVPLSAFTHFEMQPSPLTISHQGQFPVVTVSFNVAEGSSLGQAVDAVKRAQAHLNMPASVIVGFQGTAAAYTAIGGNEALLIMAALLAVYIVLGVLYESFIHPLTILSTLPSAGVGALLALRLFGQSLDIIAVIGIILLIGIVKKNGIMIVDFALEAERVHGKNSSRSHLRSFAASLPPHPHDHPGRALCRHPAGLRHRHRL